MTLNLLQNVNPADIFAYARQVPEDEDFFLTREVLPTVVRNSVKWRIKESTRYRSVAKFRAFDAETPRGRREVATKVTEGILPPLGQKLTVGELEVILQNLDRGADDTELVDELYDDAEAHVRSIRARLELAAGDLLTDGKFELVDENGLTLDADFQVPAAFLPTAAIPWTDLANAKPLDDEQAWIRQLVKNGEGRPVGGFSSDAVLALFAGNFQYQRTYFGTVQSSYPTLTPDQVDAVRARYRLPALRAYDTQVRVDGVVKRVTDEGQFFLYGSDVGQTQMGVTAESIVLSRTGNPRIAKEDQPGITVTTWETAEPVAVGTKGSAVGMPLLFSSKAYIGAKVAAF